MAPTAVRSCFDGGVHRSRRRGRRPVLATMQKLVVSDTAASVGRSSDGTHHDRSDFSCWSSSNEKRRREAWRLDASASCHGVLLVGVPAAEVVVALDDPLNVGYAG
jgi:hypothetical protein